jgi:hypothetical protein
MTGAAVEGAITTVEDPETRESLATIVGDPALHDALADATAALTRGALTGVGDIELDLLNQEKIEQVERAAEAIGAAMTRGLARGFAEGREGLPSTERMMDKAISGALASATSDVNRERTRLLVSGTTEALVRSMTSSLAAGVEEDLSPVVRGARGEAKPLVAGVLGDDEVQHAVGGMLYEVSRQSTLGFQRAMNEIREENRAAQQGIIGRISGAGWGLLAVLIGLLLAAIVAIIALAVRNRRQREQIAVDDREREQVMATLYTALAGKEEAIDEGARTAILRHLGLVPQPPGDAAASTPTSTPTSTGPSRLIPATE